MSFGASIDLSSLDGTNGFVLNGIDQGDFSGHSVSNAGDVNGDGIDDLIIGAYMASPDGRTDAGESYVVFGTRDGFAAAFALSSLDGSNGFVLKGPGPNALSGYSVSNAGDVNGDRIDDLIISAYGVAPGGRLSAGASYVVFGSTDGFAASLDLSTLDGTNGFVLNGVDQNDFSGWSVSNAGDINGDGVDDVIIGAFSADPNNQIGAGESYVVFGSTDGFAASADLSALNGTTGFVLNGIGQNDLSGFSVSAAGDVNGDKVDDLIIGAYLADPNGRTSSGESYVVFGTKAGFSASLNLATLNGTNGFTINGIGQGDSAGRSVSNAGDINGDGIDDLVIGAFSVDPDGRTNAGAAYVVFGSTDGFSASFDLSTLNGTNGFALNGLDIGDNTGWSVSGAGDVNGDGTDDLIIGALNADPSERSNAGQSYVVFGSKNGFGATLDLSALDGTNGFVINGITANDLSGRSVSGAGDINADGADDLIIGASDSNTTTGTSYVIFGIGPDNEQPVVETNTGAEIDLEDTFFFGTDDLETTDEDDDPDGLTYTVTDAPDLGTLFRDSGSQNGAYDAGEALGAGDTFTQQEIDDGLIGYVADGTATGPDFFDFDVADGGENDTTAISDSFDFALVNCIEGTEGNDARLRGSRLDDKIKGFGGNDRLWGRQGDDELLGGNGNDYLEGGSGDDILNGGAGNDFLDGDWGMDTFVFEGAFGNDRVIGYRPGREKIVIVGADDLDTNGDGWIDWRDADVSVSWRRNLTVEVDGDSITFFRTTRIDADDVRYDALDAL